MHPSSNSPQGRRGAAGRDASIGDARPVTRIDDALLVELGFASMGAADRGALAAALQDELERRVGRALTDGLDDELLDEFERLIAGDVALARRWLSTHCRPGDDGRLAAFAARRGATEPLPGALLLEWASMLWLEWWCPDYKEVVARMFDAIRAELLAYRDRLLATD